MKICLRENNVLQFLSVFIETSYPWHAFETQEQSGAVGLLWTACLSEKTT